MPFTISYSDEVQAVFRASPAWDIVMVRALVGSFKHDRWLRGEPVEGQSTPGTELMQLSNKQITLRYEISRKTERVHIVAITRD